MKKGQSAMVATVLLIMMAIVAGVLVTSFSQKSGKKVSEKIVEIGSGVECNDIRLGLKVEGGNLILRNRGTLGIDKVVLRKYSGNTVEAPETIDTFDGEEKLMPGKDESDNIIEFDAGSVGDYVKIEIKPIFLSEEGDMMGCSEVVYEKP